MTEHVTDMKGEIEVLEDLIHQTDRAREQLKIELIARIADLPSRNFIEVQLIQLSTRVDRMIDSKLGHN